MLFFFGTFQIGFWDDMKSIPVVMQNLDFSASSFENDIDICNVVFSPCFTSSSKDSNLLNFRNARVFGGVKMRNLRFVDTSADHRISFEDARISGNFEITNSDLEHVGIYCFQTIFGDFLASSAKNTDENSILLNNLRFEDDAHIDFVDAEVDNGKMRVCNIPYLPRIDLCFSSKQSGGMSFCPNNKLQIYNCDIQRQFNISNFSEVSFAKTRNFGRIVADERWCDVDVSAWRETHNSKYRKKSKGIGGTCVNNKLLLAVYNYEIKGTSEQKRNINNYYKAKDFVMLKENFLSQGMYDEEDIAFILYMEFKPYIDSYNKMGDLNKVRKRRSTSLLYNILYASGKYGISPIRVVNVLLLTVVIFAALYFAVSISVDDNAFSIGNVILSNNNILFRICKRIFFDSATIGVESFSAKLIGSFFYSLESIVPFIAQFEPYNITIMCLSFVENFIGTFMMGYFSVAIIRKTLR